MQIATRVAHAEEEIWKAAFADYAEPKELSLSEDKNIRETAWNVRVTTERAEFTFVVKEGCEGQLSVTAEPLSRLKGLSGLIQLELNDDTSMDEAHEVAKLMRRYVRSIAVTAFH